MPVIINEIVIKSTVEKDPNMPNGAASPVQASQNTEEIVKQAVEKMFEILEEKKLR
jgi:hypothetical protein